MCAQSAMAIVSNEGHLGRAAEQLASKDSIIALGKAMAAAGLVAAASQFMGTPASASDATARATEDAAKMAGDAGLTAPTAAQSFSAAWFTLLFDKDTHGIKNRHRIRRGLGNGWICF